MTTPTPDFLRNLAAAERMATKLTKFSKRKGAIGPHVDIENATPRQLAEYCLWAAKNLREVMGYRPEINGYLGGWELKLLTHVSDEFTRLADKKGKP